MGNSEHKPTFYAIALNPFIEPFTMMPSKVYEEQGVTNYFKKLGYTNKPLLKQEAVEVINKIEIGIGCFAMDGINILADETRRIAARKQLSLLSSFVRIYFDFDPVGINLNRIN